MICLFKEVTKAPSSKMKVIPKSERIVKYKSELVIGIIVL